jgi:hypothetical protein
MNQFHTEDFKFDLDIQQPGGKGHKKRIRISFDATDVIAFAAALIALAFTAAILIGTVPLNSMTLGIITFSAVLPGIAKLAQAFAKKKSKDD